MNVVLHPVPMRAAEYKTTHHFRGQVPSEPNFFRTAYNVFGVDRLFSVKVQLHMETEWRLCLNSMIKHIFVLHAQSLIQR